VTDSTALRVCLWSPLPPPQGGIGRWAERLRDASPGHGLDVRVVNTSPRTDAFSERSVFRWDRVTRALGAYADLEHTLLRFRPQVLHIATSLFWATPRDAAAMTLARAHGVPTIWHMHGSNQMILWRNQMSRPRRRLFDAVLRAASHVVVLSEEMNAYLRKSLPGLQVSLLGNMVELEIPPGPAVLPAKSKPRVLFVGPKVPLKGLGELAAAVVRMPGVELALVGGDGGVIDPVQAAIMQGHLQTLRDQGRLLETGNLPPDACQRTYREADVFALPTWREGLPNVLLEAMAAGLPCVTTPVGAIPEVIQGGCALTVTPGDVDALTATLARVLHDPDLRADLGRRARERVVQTYGIDAVMADYARLYRQVART
jgi:glycosyltransferase involved in cell wall biosynthesis